MRVIVDNGASSACIAAENPWLPYLKREVVNYFPRGTVKVGDAKILRVSQVVNLKFHGRYCLKGYRTGQHGNTEAYGELTCHRVLVVDGLDPEVILLSVHQLRKLDDVHTFFNNNNTYKVDNCIRLPSGVFVPFRPGKDTYEVEICAEPEPTAPTPTKATAATNANRVRPTGNSPKRRAAYSRRSAMPERTRISLTRITIGGLRPALLKETHLCRDCLAGAPKPAKAGGSRPRGHQNKKHTPPTYYGQLVYSDMCTSFPTSWPHSFNSMVCFCDDYTAEKAFYFTRTSSSEEVASAL
jgi:hypothetical protein